MADKVTGRGEQSAPNRLLIMGAGGHAKVVADCAESTGIWGPIVMFDDTYPNTARVSGWNVVGTFADIFAYYRAGDAAFVGIGNNGTRLTWLEKLAEAGIAIATISHPRATVAKSVRLGVGSLVVAGAVINIDSAIGRGVIINTAASVDHDCQIADGAHICPGTHLGGNVSVGARSWIGIGSSIKQGIRIGTDVTVGAGAVVVKDVTSGTTVIGAPARTLLK